MNDRHSAEALIVEDEVFVVLDLEDVLLEQGFRIAASYSSNAQALEWLKDHRPAIAIVDFRLRDGTSAPVARALRAMGVPTVVYSGNAFEADLHQEDFGSFPWVDKPTNIEDLVAAVRLAIGTHSRLSS